MFRPRIAAVGLVAVLLPGLAGCHSGMDAATNVQQASGDGVEVKSGAIAVNALTLVAGNEGSGKAALLGTVFNNGAAADRLVGVTADGIAATLTPADVEVKPNGSVDIQTGKTAQAEFTGFKAQAGQYVPVALKFQQAGELTAQVLIVPPTGFYADAAPKGTTPVVREESGAEEETASHG